MPKLPVPRAGIVRVPDGPETSLLAGISGQRCGPGAYPHRGTPRPYHHRPTCRVCGSGKSSGQPSRRESSANTHAIFCRGTSQRALTRASVKGALRHSRLPGPQPFLFDTTWVLGDYSGRDGGSIRRSPPAYHLYMASEQGDSNYALTATDVRLRQKIGASSIG